MRNTNTNKILKLFYNKHYTSTSIADLVGVSMPYVSKVIKKDSRYKNEKTARKNLTVEDHKMTNNANMKKVREQRRIDEAYYILKEQHRQAVSELSIRKRLTNEGYRKWNSSAYSFNDKKNRFEFKGTLGRTADVPKYIKVNI